MSIVTKMKIVSVVVPIPVFQAYSYGVEPHIEVKVGSFVRVPVAGREICGFVVALGESIFEEEQKDSLKKITAVSVARDKLRFVTHVFDCPPLKA
ncbi:MAG: primosomal protein N', partial [Bartonella sp.]|nr:primosomal protein N' [Bartonella sp.]